VPRAAVSFRQAAWAAVADLQPAYFSVVMATGIVALGAHFEIRARSVAVALTWLNAGFFVILWVLSLLRAIRFPGRFLDDLHHFDRGPGFFAMVAATTVAGTQAWIILGHAGIAVALWWIAIPMWACFMYAIFTEFTINEHKPRFENGINGGWLISVVATQGIADLGARVSSLYPDWRGPILFFSLALWLAGGMLYLWLISLIFYRFTFFRFLPRDFIPPFWINMGAMAISTLAGATLIGEARGDALLTGLAPFLKGFTIFFWATATWWIPMLAILAFWDHVIKKSGRTFTFLYWDVVFPIGMYTVATYQLCAALDLGFLLWLPRFMMGVAVVAWLATFAGMVRSFARIAPHRRTG
jgi:tellurite resistance protein TehA-like permease